MKTNTQALLNTVELEAARDWLKDVSFKDLEPEDIDELTDRQLEIAILRFFGGGISEFKRTC